MVADRGLGELSALRHRGEDALGAVAINTLAVRRARIKRLELDELVIGGRPFRRSMASPAHFMKQREGGDAGPRRAWRVRGTVEGTMQSVRALLAAGAELARRVSLPVEMGRVESRSDDEAH